MGPGSTSLLFFQKTALWILEDSSVPALPNPPLPTAAPKETWLWFCSPLSEFVPASVQPLQRTAGRGCFSCPGLISAPIGTGFPRGSVVKNLPANAGDARDAGFIPGSGGFLWSRKWQPTPVFLARKFHGQRSLAGYSPWGRKQTHPEWLSKHARTASALSQVEVCVETVKTCPRIAFDRLGASCKVSAEKRKERLSSPNGVEYTLNNWCYCTSFFPFNPSFQLVKLWGFMFLSLRVSPSFLCDFRGLWCLC